MDLCQYDGVPRMRSRTMVGRGEELGILLAAADRARAGDVALTLVTGEAGIGKTRLVEEALARFEPDGLVLVGHGVELETGELPFGVLAETMHDVAVQVGAAGIEELLGPRAAALAPLVPDLGGTHPESDRGALMAAALALFEQLARERLVCWVVEDLQWVDAPSRDIFSLLARTSRGVRLLLVGTVRTEESTFPPHFDSLARLPHAEVIPLQRLAESEVIAQLQAMGSRLSPADRRRVVTLSDGVPFLVEELTGWRGDDVTPSVSALASRRLDALGPDERRFVEAAALGEGYLYPSLVARAAGLHRSTVDSALNQSIAAGILRLLPEPGTLTFRHALLRAAVDQRIGPDTRNSLHRGWGEVLQEAPREMPRDHALIAAANHWFLTDDLDRAFDSAVMGAAAAARLEAASDEGTMQHRLAQLWDRAADPEARSGTTRRDALVQCLHLLVGSDGPDRAIEIAQAELAATPEDTSQWAFLQLLIGRTTIGKGVLGLGLHTSEELDSYEIALQEGPDDLMNVVGRMFLASVLTDDERADRLAAEALRIAGNLEHQLVGSIVPGMRSWRLLALGRAEEAAELLERAVKAGHLKAFDLGTLEGNLCWFLGTQGRHEEAVRVARRSMARFPDPRVAPWIWNHLSENLAWSLTMTGEWAEAESLLQACRNAASPELDVINQRLDTLELLRTGAVARESAWRDSLDAPQEAWAPALADRLSLLAGCAADRRDAEEFRALCARLWEQPDPSYDSDTLWEGVLRAIRFEASERLRSGVSREARGHVTEIRATAAQLHRLGGLGRAWSTEFDAELALFQGEQCRELFEQALAAWQAIGHVYDEAYCHFRLAECCLDDGDRDEAASHIAAAWDTCDRLGARPLGEQVQAVARRARLHRHAGLADTGPDPVRRLTARELEVLALLALGRSNGQIAAELFMSPKTASVHVSRIITKLGAANRTEAAAIARREALLPD
jgi:DNA-binding CsgD family transcriptional regulator